MTSPTYSLSPTAEHARNPKRNRPCDACRRCKSKCVKQDGLAICLLCQLYSRDCTYLQEPATRKRKTAEDHVLDASSASLPLSTARKKTKEHGDDAKDEVEEYDDLDIPTLLKRTLGLRHKHHSQVIGATASLEPSLLGDRPVGLEELPLSRGVIRRVDQRNVFLVLPDKGTQNHQDDVSNLDEIEATVAPHGKALVALYFRIVHPSWPILHKDVFLEKYARSYREFSSPLLAAVYLLSVHYWSYDDSLSDHDKPDVQKLALLAKRTLADTIHRPKLSTVQAGLLLLQYTEQDQAELTPQLVNVGYSLGLHLDSSDWSIPDWEKGLRNRLGWSLYLQDKFSSLGTGRPPLIASANWALQPLKGSEFPENAAHEDDREGSSEVEQGRILFSQMILLTEILTDLLEQILSVRAARQIAEAGDSGLLMILEKAKPIQLRLRNWITNLPDCLHMDSINVLKLSSVGHLRLAYLAVEMTLHRRIVQALTPDTPPPLYEICRSAACERFISAVDFVQSLRPQHLQSFWYFASAQNFALIGTFGCLLLGTSHGADVEFYRGKLKEYRWMLKLHSQNGAKFMKPAVGILDDNLMLVTEYSSRSEAATAGTAAAETPTESLGQTPNLGFVDTGRQSQIHAMRRILSPGDMSVYSLEDFQHDVRVDYQGMLGAAALQVDYEPDTTDFGT